MSTQKHKHKGGGGPRLREVGLEPEKERDFVCVCFSFVFVYSFVERGCWQHQNHYSLKCLFTLSLFHRVVVKEYYSKVRLKFVVDFDDDDDDATAPDRSIDRSFASSSFTSSSVFVFIESGKNADFSDWKD